LEIHIEAITNRLAQMLKAVVHRYPTEGLPIISGFSQGGILTFGLALRHPELVSAAHPISGFLPTALWPMRPRSGAANPPIRAAHGTADRVVPFEPTRSMTAALKKRGFDIRLRGFPGVGHAKSLAMREMSDAFIQNAIAEETQ
jgi:phospholipase/carboxylesterase